MDWKKNAINVLKDSLFPVPIELNEIDWKSGLSPKTDRLAQHISAFANQSNGGILVFGVNNDGTHFSISKDDADRIIQLLGNIAKNNLSYSIALEHSIIEYEGSALLFIYIPEQKEKPVHLKGSDIYNSYHRSAGSTVKMSKQQVKLLIALSQGISFEEQIALDNLSQKDVLSLLNYKKFYELRDKNAPQSSNIIFNNLMEYEFCLQKDNHFAITNLGALLFANNMSDFPTIKNCSIIVRKYIGDSNLELEFEKIGKYGYAVGFVGLIQFIMNNTPKKEKIQDIRKLEFMYPEIAIREFVANALVHQDFAITGSPVTIEIFSNRISISNVGAPLNDINRLIDLPPRSRNEKLAETMHLLNICERRGSGIDRAITEIEKKNLPPVKFSKSEQYTRVFLFAPKQLNYMTKEEKIRACYQHACILNEKCIALNNTTLRERFGLDKNKTSVASRIINDTLEAGYIKPLDDESLSKKGAKYIPYYA